MSAMKSPYHSLRLMSDMACGLLKNSFGVFAQKTRRARMPYKRFSPPPGYISGHPISAVSATEGTFSTATPDYNSYRSVLEICQDSGVEFWHWRNTLLSMSILCCCTSLPFTLRDCLLYSLKLWRNEIESSRRQLAFGGARCPGSSVGLHHLFF
jgi:hypothetical protein